MEEIINEKIIFESLVQYRKSKSDILLKLTNQNIILEKKKGLFKKKYKRIENILVEEIKVVGDKVKVEHKKKLLKIYTNEKEFEIVFNNTNEARKVKELIIELKTGSNLLERTSKKVVKISNVAKKSVKAIGGATIAIVGTYKAIKDNKDVVLDAAKTVKSLLKK